MSVKVQLSSHAFRLHLRCHSRSELSCWCNLLKIVVTLPPGLANSARRFENPSHANIPAVSAILVLKHDPRGAGCLPVDKASAQRYFFSQWGMLTLLGRRVRLARVLRAYRLN